MNKWASILILTFILVSIGCSENVGNEPIVAPTMVLTSTSKSTAVAIIKTTKENKPEPTSLPTLTATKEPSPTASQTPTLTPSPSNTPTPTPSSTPTTAPSAPPTYIASDTPIPTPVPTAPLPTSTPLSGSIDVQVAGDIITWNITALGGASYRQHSAASPITRWELPVPVYIQESEDLDRDAVIEALNYWSSKGISYVLLSNDSFPRLYIRSGTDGLAPHGGGRGLVDGTYSNNQASSGLVVIQPRGENTYCGDPWSGMCRYLFRHEIGHALGFFGHSDGGLMGSGSPDLSDREYRMMTTLYSLPHGTSVQQDGTWQVVQ